MIRMSNFPTFTGPVCGRIREPPCSPHIHIHHIDQNIRVMESYLRPQPTKDKRESKIQKKTKGRAHLNQTGDSDNSGGHKEQSGDSRLDCVLDLTA